MKNNLFFSAALLTVLTILFAIHGCCKEKDSDEGVCFDKNEVTLTILKVEGMDADNCDLNDASLCPVYCKQQPCKIEISGDTEGLANATCDWVYAWVKHLDGDNLYHRNEKPINIGIQNGGLWTDNIQLGENGNTGFGDRFEIVVTVSKNDISQTSTTKFDGLGIEKESNHIRVEVVGCFNPDLVSNFSIVKVEDIPVINYKVDSLDCSSVHSDIPCKIFIQGNSNGIYSQECAEIVVLLRPATTDHWFVQDVIGALNADGSWQMNAQLGDITPNTDPRGQSFELTAFATSVDLSQIPTNFDNMELQSIFMFSNSVKITNDVKITVKKP